MKSGPAVKLTYDDFVDFPDDGKRHELIDGCHFVTEVDVVEPDLVYISNERASIITPAHARGAPDLVVEIASPGTRRRDETLKRRLYERDGVTEYWVVDGDLNRIRVYRRAGPSFGRPIELTREAGDVLTSPLFPRLTLPLVRLLQD